MTDHTTNEIPYGYCHCGCGQKTWIPATSNKKYGWIKGEPVRYVSGHNNHNADMPKVGQNPSGLCMCGCGQATPLARQTDTRSGCVKGQPMRYCNGHGLSKPLPERFWKYVAPGKTDECWEWQGSFKQGGYGKLSHHNQSLSAHRVSWELHNGTAPDGLNVLHKCDNPACVNPNHLFLGTQKDNVQDMIDKGRAVFGGRKYKPKQ